MKIMLICGLHWHSRYSIVDFYIVLMHFRVVYREFLWPICNDCVQNCVQMEGWLIYDIEMSFCQQEQPVHITFITLQCNFVQFSHFVIPHVSHVQMTQVYHFTIVASVEASSPLKVLSFLSKSFIHHEFIVSLFYHESLSSNFILCELYSIATMNWIYNEWCWALFNVNFMKLYYCELYMNPEWHLNGCEMIWMELQ